MTFAPRPDARSIASVLLLAAAAARAEPGARDDLVAAVISRCTRAAETAAAPFGSESRVEPGAAVVRLADDGVPEVVAFATRSDIPAAAANTVLIYGDEGGDRCAVAAGSDASGQGDAWRALGALGRGLAGGAPAETAVTTESAIASLPQLSGGETVRSGATLRLPFDGAVLLDGRVRVRRAEEEATDEASGRILAGAREILRFRVPAGAATADWAALAADRADLAGGLPAGEYRLELEAGIGVERVAFRVLGAEERDRVLSRSATLARLLGSDRDPLVVQVAAEALLAHDPPLLADADALLATLSDADRTDHLRRLAAGIESRLRSATPQDARAAFVFPAPAPVADARDADPRLSALRAHVVAGRWQEARPIWHDLSGGTDPRAAGVARLCRAMFLAQGSAHLAPAADAEFRAAWAALAEHGTADDRRRACVNHGNYLLRGAAAELHNHALRIAVGVPLSLVKAAARVADAAVAFERAQALAADDAERATALVGLARTYALLADVLDRAAPDARDGPVHACRRAAFETAAALADAGVAAAPRDLHDVRAVGREVRGRIAFRAGDTAAAREATLDALREYVAAGSLAGAESAHRTLGLLAAASAPAEALDHLLVSLEIGDLLRDRMLSDPAGIARAGFAAQRSYVTERIVGLLVALGRPRDALLAAERAKARSLTDVLALRTTDEGPGADALPAGGADLLTDWPADVAAVEYFIGAEAAWIFTIDPRGEVAARPLADAGGAPLRPDAFVARVQDFLRGIDTLGTRVGPRLAQRAAAGLPVTFDRSWQDELAAFHDILLPPPVRGAVAGAATVVVVPHHILHYMPFAALVVKPDTRSAPDRMPRPEFLVDQPFSLVHAPSLTSWRALRRHPVRRITEARVLGIVDFLGAAPALEGVTRDVANFRDVFGPRLAAVVQEEAATEAAAAALVGQPGLVALCTHGQKVPDQPLAAYLACRRGDDDDGRLTASEVYGLDVRADLVILNCCYGGFADRAPLPGDDLFGMQRALLTRGGGTVVSGLWDIFDATAPDIVRGFCTRLDAGAGAAAALAGSQRDFLARWREAEPEVMRFLTHPYYWAVFTVAGDDRTTLAVTAGRRDISNLRGDSPNPPPDPEER